jgi:hypothetical protein
MVGKKGGQERIEDRVNMIKAQYKGKYHSDIHKFGWVLEAHTCNPGYF